MITIPLTKPDARLCELACAAEGDEMLFTTGPNTLSRSAWYGVQQRLEWYATDLDRRLNWKRRVAADALASRIEKRIDEYDWEHPPEPVRPRRIVQRQLELSGA